MIKNALVLLVSSSLAGACADAPNPRAQLNEPCHGAAVDSSEQIPAASKELPHSNILKLGYTYPENLNRQRLQGRALIRLEVAATGKIESAEFLRAEAPPPVAAAMCNLLGKLKYDVTKPGFDSVEARTFVLGIRYCLGNCNRVPIYPGYEKMEIAITGSLLPPNGP